MDRPFMTWQHKDILLDEKDKEIERLRKEKEWLINELVIEQFYEDELQQSEKIKLMARMQQALKEA